MLGLLVVGILIAGSPGYAQRPDPGGSDLNGIGPEVVPIVTRAWAHDDFGRMVFDWPWAVAYGARIEGKTLTVMFDRRLHTTFQQIPRRLGAYITDVDIGPDGQSVVASLTNEYRLRTFLLNNEEGGVKVVVDLLADGEAGPVLAQAPTPPSLPFAIETSPASEDAPDSSPPIGVRASSPQAAKMAALPGSGRGEEGDTPPVKADAETPPAESDSSPESAQTAEAPPPVETTTAPEGGENPPRPTATPPRRGSEDSPPVETEAASEAEAASSGEAEAAPDSGAETASEAAPDSSPPTGVPASSPQAAKMAALPGSERGEEEVTPPVKADAETPPAESDSSPESVPTAEATPPVEETTAPEPVTETVPEAASPAETAAAPETAPESSPPGRGAAQRRGGSTDVPPSLDPTGEQVAEQSADQTAVPISETATERAEGNPPRPSATPPERGSEAAASPVTADTDAPSAEPTQETASEDTPPAETAETAVKAAPPVTTDPTPESLTPNPQFPTLPVSVRIPLSQSRLFRLETPVASVFVANPEIADVQLVSSGVLFVVAKAVGRTSVAALDADSELVGEWTIATVLDIQPARAAIEGVPALKNVAVRQLNRGVELSGAVASVAAADMALRLTTTALPEETPVENRISVTGKQQVNLEVQIAEVQRSVSETLGFNWEVLPDIGAGRDLGMRVGRFFFSEATGFVSRELIEGQAAALFGSTGISPGRTTVRGLIDALATAGLATVLARPNVTAVSGETASFFSGGEYPLPSGFEDGAIIFEYKKYGVLLDFVPTIIDSGRIMLTVRPEVSQRSDTDSLTVVGIEIPVINVRRAETTVEVGDGESIVIAGLYRDQSEAVEAGLPVVKDIPLLGMLFGSQSVRSNATELIVVVTARLTTATTMPRTTDWDRQLPGRRLRGYHY